MRVGALGSRSCSSTQSLCDTGYLAPPGRPHASTTGNADASTYQMNVAPVPWSSTSGTVYPSVSATVMVQGDGDRVCCRIRCCRVVPRPGGSCAPRRHCRAASSAGSGTGARRADHRRPRQDRRDPRAAGGRAGVACGLLRLAGGHLSNGRSRQLRGSSRLRNRVIWAAARSGSSNSTMWPAPGISAIVARGMRRAIRRALATGMIGSRFPCSTSVGCWSRPSHGWLVHPVMA